VTRRPGSESTVAAALAGRCGPAAATPCPAGHGPPAWRRPGPTPLRDGPAQVSVARAKVTARPGRVGPSRNIFEIQAARRNHRAGPGTRDLAA
jgi:hypothetical protein